MGGFLATFLMCAIGITAFLFFGLGLFYNFWGIVGIAAFLMALVITAFSELWKKTDELENRIREMEEEQEQMQRRGVRGTHGNRGIGGRGRNAGRDLRKSRRRG